MLNSRRKFMAKKNKKAKPSNMKTQREIDTDTSSHSNQLLNKIILRGYQIHDNIILSNFENITQLEVSENNIEYLDLSTLKKLEILQCRKNALSELIVDGGCLISLTATYNDLTKISLLSGPSKLTFLNISNNKLKELPRWLDKCLSLQHLYANNNILEEIPPSFINVLKVSLQTLQIANNKITSLPNFPNEKIPLQELCIQCNQLEQLPDDLFASCNELHTLNISYNKLEHLPSANKDNNLPLKSIFATKNQLKDEALELMFSFRKLKVVHFAHNDLRNLPGTCIDNWPELEELVFSGNKLEKLPETISSLRRLRVLRVHSNLLQSIPDLSQISTLRVIDLAHNQLGKINLETMLPKNVRFLDLSCNQKLQVDSSQLKTFQSKRSISFVDVSGKDRFSLPTSASLRHTSNSFSPWKVGFSETSGNCPKLWVSQLRLTHFCNTEGLFGMFDGQARNTSMNLLPKIIPTFLLQHRARNNSSEYMKYTLISAYESLKPVNQEFDDCAILCHITKEKPCHEFPEKIRRSRKYILRAAVVGGTTAYLIRKQGPVLLPPSSNKNTLSKQPKSRKSVMDAHVFEVSLNAEDEYLVICSKNIWETVQIETVVQEIQSEENLILAAKRIQDVAQGFGLEENISIIILKFQNVETYVDLLINELRQNVRKKSVLYNCPSCCYSADGNLTGKHLCANSDRSSPIGQSDQEISELSVCLKQIKSDTQCLSERRVSSIKSQSCHEDNVSRGFPVLEEESDLTENDSLLSEEQFKCWEYMLEQNTQLLFDKELNKITNSIIRKENSSSSINLNGNNSATSFNLLNATTKSKMSASFPQLIHRDMKELNSHNTKSLGSKQFGSARSFQQFASIKTTTHKNVKDRTIPGEDTNLGYFGSLQHLLPYNFENEFSVTHERQLGDESMEYASRMSQYWGVTSTEL